MGLIEVSSSIGLFVSLTHPNMDSKQWDQGHEVVLRDVVLHILILS